MEREDRDEKGRERNYIVRKGEGKTRENKNEGIR